MYTQKHSTVQVAWAKLWVLLAFVLVSCKPTVPSDYIQPGEMEDLLYDYHVAMSMAAVKNANPTEQEAYKLAVFERYGIDETVEKDLRKYRRTTEKGSTSARYIGFRLQSIRRCFAQRRYC